MKEAKQRWLKEGITSTSVSLSDMQWDFRFYSYNIYVLNHVNLAIDLECTENSALATQDYGV